MALTIATTTPGEPEIFASLQGEGRSAGLPCTFVRLSRCNLACQWCDTAYTWRFEGDNRPHRDGLRFDRKANQITLSEEDVAARIMALGGNRLVITGGEPLLQGAALARMVSLLPRADGAAKSLLPRVGGGLVPASAEAAQGPRLRGEAREETARVPRLRGEAQGIAIEIETNGTVEPHPELDALVSQYNVSPKLSHSGNAADIALISERLLAWANEPKAHFKFVISAPEDLAEVLDLIDRYALPKARVQLMPEGTTSAVLRTRELWLAPLCLQHGLGLSDRLHIHLYGDSRGT